MPPTTLLVGPSTRRCVNDAFPAHTFDFMLSNPPYGKSWKGDLERMGGKAGLRDPRFVVDHAGIPDMSLVTRSSDGQLLFLANMLSKMKHDTPLGSRIATVHNASSLYAGDAGQGESNIRRWAFENDWVESIIALPGNMFYNTSILTYIWVLTNRKAPHRRGFVQLIDATSWYRPLAKSLGNKSREFGEEDIARITAVHREFDDNEHSRILPNNAFGYWKVVVERPLRAVGGDAGRAYSATEIRALRASDRCGPDGTPVIRRIHKSLPADPLRGLFETHIGGRNVAVEYEPDPALRDIEQIDMTEPGGVDAFFAREVLPFTQDAWMRGDAVQVGYEVNFRKYFYLPTELPSLEQFSARIEELENRTHSVVAALLAGGSE